LIIRRWGDAGAHWWNRGDGRLRCLGRSAASQMVEAKRL